MPRPHTTMRRIRDVLRLRLGENLSVRDQVSLRFDAAHHGRRLRPIRATTRGSHVWPLPEEMGRRRAGAPDCSRHPRKCAQHLPAGLREHEEGTREEGHDPHVALGRIPRAAPRRLRLQPVLPALPRLAHDPRRRRCARTTRRARRCSSTSRVSRSRSTTSATSRCAFAPSCSSRCSAPPTTSTPRRCAARNWCTGWRAHVARLRVLRGLPEIVVRDNLRSGVTKPHRYEPDLNATYQEMAPPLRHRRHPRAPLQARATRPRSKPACCSPSAGSSRCCASDASRPRRSSTRRSRSCVERTQRPSRSRRWTDLAPSSSKSSTARRCVRCPRTRYEFATWKPRQGQHRLPRRGRTPLLLRPLPTRRPGRRRAPDRSVRRGLLRSTGASPRHLRSYAKGSPSPTRRTCRVAPPPREWTPAASSPGRRRPDPPPRCSSRR